MLVAYPAWSRAFENIIMLDHYIAPDGRRAMPCHARCAPRGGLPLFHIDCAMQDTIRAASFQGFSPAWGFRGVWRFGGCRFLRGA